MTGGHSQGGMVARSSRPAGTNASCAKVRAIGRGSARRTGLPATPGRGAAVATQGQRFDKYAMTCSASGAEDDACKASGFEVFDIFALMRQAMSICVQ
eukprot:11332878-Karenia_brevis.AAC.1